MSLRAIYTDLGGVLVRTEDPGPRARLAESLGLTARELERIVFENESSARASVGGITHDQHWQNVARSLQLPESEVPRLRDEFFGGDRVDSELVDFLRAARQTVRVGLISNAWSDLRAWITGRGFVDAFDALVISAEAGVMKPDPGIYRLALEKLGAAPQEAVFVDDMPANVEGARAVGMQAFTFTTTKEVLDQIRQLLSNHR